MQPSSHQRRIDVVHSPILYSDLKRVAGADDGTEGNMSGVRKKEWKLESQ